MDSGYLPRLEHEEFARRIEEENDRTNFRLKKLEEQGEERNRLLLSVERLATNIENMQKQLSAHDERLEAIENRDGETWRKVKWYVLTVIVGAIIGYCISSLGI